MQIPLSVGLHRLCTHSEQTGPLPPQPDGASSEPIDRGTLDPHSIAERIETGLTTMYLPINFRPNVRAAYSPIRAKQ